MLDDLEILLLQQFADLVRLTPNPPSGSFRNHYQDGSFVTIGRISIRPPFFEFDTNFTGTNRSQFFRGEINKYGWVDTGSSFLPSDVIAAFLYAQLENIDVIQGRRKAIWETYRAKLAPLEEQKFFKTAKLPSYATNNAHMFYIVCNSFEERSSLISHLKSKGIWSVFHYLALHKSEYYAEKHDGRSLPMSDMYENCLLRLPLFYELSNREIEFICEEISNFFLK